MSTTLTQANVNRYIRIALGSPIVEVELTDEMITEITNQSLGVYGTWKPVEKFGQVSIIAGQQVYTLTADQVGKGIVEVFRPDLMRQAVSLDQFDVFRHHSFTPNLDPGDYYAERLWWKEVRRSAGSEDDWECILDPITGSAALFINPIPSASYTLSYFYIKDPTLAEVPGSDDDWIKDHILASCMVTLGHIRSKYKGVAGSEGSIDMDGEDLIARGEDKRKNVEEYLEKRGQVVPPIRG